MKPKQFHDLQNQIFEYFEKTDDGLLQGFIESFVFLKGTNNQEVSELAKKFLEEHGLNTTYPNYILDLRDEEQGNNRMFIRASMSERDMIISIQHALLVLAYNRFAWIIKSGKLQPKAVKPKLNKPDAVKVHYKDGDSVVHIQHPHRSEYGVCGDILEGSEIAKTTYQSKSKVTCPQCLAIARLFKTTEI